MQILQGRNARSGLSMSNAARKQLGIQPEVIRNIDKHPILPLHDIHIGRQVIYQDSRSKHWYPAVIDSYKITKRDGITYRKTQPHLKPLTPQNKNFQSNPSVSPSMAQNIHMWPVKAALKKKSQVNNQTQVQ